MKTIQKHGHVKSYKGTQDAAHANKPLVLFVGRELNDWKMIPAQDPVRTELYVATMQRAAQRVNEDLQWDSNSVCQSHYVLPDQEPFAGAVQPSWTNFNGVAFKIAEIATGTASKESKNAFSRRVKTNGGSPVLFADLSPIGLPANYANPTGKREYRLAQEELLDGFCQETIEFLQAKPASGLSLLERIGLVVFCGADDELASRAERYAKAIQAANPNTIVVTKYPFLRNYAEGGPSGYVDLLRTQHPQAYQRLQEIMKHWSFNR